MCNPNTAFTCNLIETGEFFYGEQRKAPALFRMAHHLPHDHDTPVLKALRDELTRKLLVPKQSLLDPRGVFVLRPGVVGSDDGPAAEGKPGAAAVAAVGPFVWVGAIAATAPADAEEGRRLAGFMPGVLTPRGSEVTVVWQGKEPPAFWALLQRDGIYKGGGYDDLYSSVKPQDVTSVASETDVRMQSTRDKYSSDNSNNSNLTAEPALRTGGRLQLGNGNAPPAASNAAASPTKPPAKPLKPLVKPKTPVPVTALGLPPSGAGARGDRESTPTKGRKSGTGTPVPAGVEATTPRPRGQTATPGGTPVSGRPGSNTQTDSRPPSITRVRSGSEHNISLLSQDQRRRTPTPTIERTPSAGKMPTDATFVRDTTPVDEVDAMMSARSAHSRDSTGSLGLGNGNSSSSGPGIALALLQSPNAHTLANNAHNILECAASKPEDKPKLFVCAAGDGDGEDYEWQALGVYDDDDLDDTTLLLLHCTKGPHYVWVGEDFDADHEKLCSDPEALLEWACQQVRPGENSLWVDIFPCDVSLQRSGEEDGAFWDAFQDGF